MSTKPANPKTTPAPESGTAIVSIPMVPAATVTAQSKAILILGIASAISIFSAFGALYAAASSKTTSIAVDARGAVVPVVPLSAPFLSESRVLGFVEECLRKAFSHDFLHHTKTIPLSQDCFTPDSADKYAFSMQSYISMMETKRMVMSLTVPKPPRVVRVYGVRGPTGEVIHWDVQAQIDIFFEGKAERIPPTRNDVEITVRRVPLEGTPRGILIDKFSVYPAKNS